MNDRAFLLWLADRLVHQYGESPYVDFVIALRSIARSLPPDRVTPVVIESEEAGKDSPVRSSCKDCDSWSSYLKRGQYRVYCANSQAFGFIGALNDKDDPGECGCPFFERAQDSGAVESMRALRKFWCSIC